LNLNNFEVALLVSTVILNKIELKAGLFQRQYSMHNSFFHPLFHADKNSSTK